MTSHNSNASSAPVRVELLGGARLLGPSGVARLERRPAALLAYLALEGPTSRQRLAGLLWPEGGESQARANLRQLLKRLRTATGVELASGEAALSLAEGVVVDAAELEARAFADDRRGALELTGELLGGLEYDDAPELEEWLLGAREALDARRREAATAESERLEGEGEFGPALEYARRRLALEPLSEEAHRRVMRLHYLSGDRGAALAAFERLKGVLREELGAEPLPETTALAREIERGAGVKPAAAHKPSLPLSALRPPVLAGREAEWEALEEAWARGQGVVLSGEPGVGKSRLMRDFLAAQPGTRALYFSGRPGDAAVPYGTHARTYRETLDAVGEANVPAWALRELARVVPGLGDPPPPDPSPTGKLRLFQAKIEPLKAAIRLGYDTLVFDDVQFVDPASAEAGGYVLAQLLSDPDARFRTFHTFRQGDLPPETEAIFRGAHAAGIVAMLELESLPPEGVDALLGSLGVPGLDALASQVTRHTGGNPQFVLETVRHLVETGQLSRGLPARLPPSGRVRELTARRLERLSSPARDLARAAAVLGADLTAARAARVLGVGPLALAEPWAELEAAQVLKGEVFTHDLVFEAALGSIPEAVRRVLHRAAAEVLEATQAAAARIGEHWLAAGEPVRAAPRLVEAAASASDLGLHAEAAGLLGRVAA